MRVDVIMPVFNSAPNLEAALASALRSPCVRNLIVIDDGSTDDSAAIAEDRNRVVVLRQENCGAAVARNVGILASRAELIAFLDADDWWASGHPETAVALLDRTDADCAMGLTQCIASEPVGAPFNSLLLGSLVCRREVFDKVGLFDPQVRYGEDLDWMLRVRDAGVAIQTTSTLSLYYRIHEGNRARLPHTSRVGLTNALHRAIARRREEVIP